MKLIAMKIFVGVLLLALAVGAVSVFAWRLDSTMGLVVQPLLPPPNAAEAGTDDEGLSAEVGSETARNVATAAIDDIKKYGVEDEVTEQALSHGGAKRSWFEWVRGTYLKWVGRCDPSDVNVPLEKLECVETRREERNAESPGAMGDAELFYRSLVAIREKKSPVQAWTAAARGEFSTPEVGWRDQKYFYRYMAHLAGAPDLIKARELISPEKFLSVIRESLRPQTVAWPEIFADGSKISFAPGETKLSQAVLLKKIQFEKQEIGFLLDNQGAATAFAFSRQGIDDAKISSLKFGGRAVVADFPGPMHADGARLIELGIRDGRIVNFLTGGGGRRSGLVVMTADGRAFPFHVQAIDPAVWGSPTWALPTWSEQKNRGVLNLSRSPEDLVAFLTLARGEKLSVFMEMLLAEESLVETKVDPLPGLNPIKDFSSARGRRLLVWRKQNDGRPSLLVLNREFSNNHAAWVAYRLGYRWAINLDCDFIDGARYYELGADGTSKPTVFGTANDGSVRSPYSRVLFFDDPRN